MDKIVDHLFVFDGAGEIKDILGNYTIYRQHKQLEGRSEKPIEKSVILKDEEPKIKTKLTYAERIEMKKLEKALERLEEEKEHSTAALMQPRSHEEIQEISDVLSRIVQEIEEKTDRWLELSEYT
jgi:ATP-binding cassette subfamily F protein uup